MLCCDIISLCTIKITLYCKVLFVLIPLSLCPYMLLPLNLPLTGLQEFRFLLPCLPPLHWCLAQQLHTMDQSQSQSQSQSLRSENQQQEKEEQEEEPQGRQWRGRRRGAGERYLCAMVAVHVAAALYLLSMHQAGTEQAFRALRQDISRGMD